jgi:uncharacterized membrane protein
MIRIRNFAENLRASYWFVPSVIAVAAVAFSFLTVWIDQRVQYDWVSHIGFFWSGGAEGARGLLSTLAGSMITVAGVIFSMTLVVLSLASSQFGPRLLRNLMRDTASQVGLGIFVATFIYCLLILRTVRSNDTVTFVPYISVTIGLVFGVASLAVLIYYIHHIAMAIQAPNVIARVANELLESADSLYPPAQHPGRKPVTSPPNFEGSRREIYASDTGYIQAVDDSQLLGLAREHDIVLQLLYRPGRFVAQGVTLMQVWPAERASDDLAAQVGRYVVIDQQRTAFQDVGFAIEQLVEIAVRALSPGINDPFTAVTCIDWLGAALRKLATKEFPAPYSFDESGDLRLVLADPIGMAYLIDLALDQIRQNAGQSVAVRLRMLEVIGGLLDEVTTLEGMSALRRQADMIGQSVSGAVPERLDRLAIEELYYQISAKWLQRGARPGAEHDGEVPSVTIVTGRDWDSAATPYSNAGAGTE